MMKVTIRLESPLESKLHQLCKDLGKTRSEVVNDLVREATRGYVISRRGPRAETAEVDEAPRDGETLTAA